MSQYSHRSAADKNVQDLYNPVLIGHMIANDKNRGLDIALNPAWRDTVTHFLVATSWPDWLPDSVDRQMWNDMTFNTTHYLRQLAPDSGAYFNEVYLLINHCLALTHLDLRLIRSSRIGNTRSSVRTTHGCEASRRRWTQTT